MAYKSLVLDLHGVVLRDRDLLHQIRENHNAYVAQKVPLSKNPAETNRLVSFAYGHTVRGLQQVYGVDTSDFEERVYGERRLLDRLTEVLYSTEFQRNAQILHQFALGHEWKVSLATNAPYSWTKKVAEAISDSVFTVCDKDTHVWPEHHVHVYVDDSRLNIEKKRRANNWIPILYADFKKPGVWFKQVSSFEDLAMYLRSLDMWIEHDHKHLFEY